MPLFDPLLLLAALGLVACSLITLNGATRNAFPGHPLYYVERQGIFAGIGVVVALLLSRMDYSRLREYKLGLYAVMVALNIVVFAMPQVNGARRWIPLPFLQFQSSEFGKVLLIVALAAFAVDRSRRLHERRTTARIMLLALVPALLVIPQPDLGTGHGLRGDRLLDPVLRRHLVEAARPGWSRCSSPRSRSCWPERRRSASMS